MQCRGCGVVATAVDGREMRTATLWCGAALMGRGALRQTGAEERVDGGAWVATSEQGVRHCALMP